ncbi:hypothetical protein CGCFRS4_v005275 [Colletotrichum fructicola]|nr:hypothetical protein CFRS1_v007284 [Colletotrichum fructicola]KAF4896870.1 hypothetical protein CGCFRS4_v005275 [Colletotrichum fructicola]KAF4936044.1 hypothetical protein CGCF245_v007086 [Colletotrichum fructicola]
MKIPTKTLAFLWSSGSLLLASGLMQYPAEAPFRFISCVALSGTDLGSIFYPKAAGISPQACQQQCALSDSHFAALGSGVDCYCSHATTGHEIPSGTDDDINDDFEHPDLQQHGYVQFRYDRYSIQFVLHWSIQFRNNYRGCLHNNIYNFIYTTVYDIIYNFFNNTVFSFLNNIIFDINLYCFVVRQQLSFNFAIFKPYHSVWESVNRFQLFIEPNQKHKYNYGVPYHISAIFNDEFFIHYISHQPDSTTFEFFRQLKRHLQPVFTSRTFIGNREFNCKLGSWHHFNTPIRPLQLIFWHFTNSNVTFRVSADILTRITRIAVFCLRFNRNIWPVLDSIWKPIVQRSGSIFWVESGYTDCYTRFYCDVYHRLTSCIH